MPRVVDLYAKMLKSYGVSRVFGLPGGEVADLIEALRREGVSYILTRHEAVAAFMADVTGQLTGRPGMCLSTVGPGATNLVSGVANAYLDRSPVVAITGQVRTDTQNTFTHQVLDLNSLFRPITKLSAMVMPRGAGDLLARAYRLAMEERPGPVYLALPSDTASREVEQPREPFGLPRARLFGGFSPDQLAQAVEMLERSSSPCILAGLGVARTGAHRELVAMAERIGAPVITFPKAKGVIPEDHPLAMGVIDASGGKMVWNFLRQADLLFAVGFDPVEVCDPWTLEAPIVYLDTVPNTDQVYPSEVELVGDIKQGLAGIRELLSPVRKWDEGRLAEYRRELDAVFADDESSTALAPQYVVRKLRERLPRNGIVSCDVGAHKQLMMQWWKTYEPNTFLVSNGLSSMGYGFSAAMAAKLARPDRPVACVIGDGGFSMVMHDLETAVRLRLPLTVVVMSDECLSLIKIVQGNRGYPATGVESVPVDYAAVARAFGARGWAAETKKEYDVALEEARNADGPCLIDARIDASFYPAQCRS